MVTMSSYEKGFREASRRRAEEKAKYLSRLATAGLEPIEGAHYGGFSAQYRPCTIEAWNLHRVLLMAEGQLTKEAEQEIDHHIQNLVIHKKMDDIAASLPDGRTLPSVIANHPAIEKSFLSTEIGRKELRLIAMRELGLQDTEAFLRLCDDVIADRMAASRSLEELYLSRPMD